jgi:hypothetical protein
MVAFVAVAAVLLVGMTGVSALPLLPSPPPQPPPAILAECDALFGTGGLDPIDLNPRRARCGPSRF